MTTIDKRAELIKALHKIIKDLEQGYGGFLYLYDLLLGENANEP